MNSNKTRIRLITCIMNEQLPAYFEYFLQTAKWNSTIDFTIFSNPAVSIDVPTNVNIVSMKQVEFRSLASEKLGFDIVMDDPNKINDFKPAFGLIFEDYLGDCDFWGYVDLHVLLGKVSAFLSDELLASHDFITVREEFPAGYFSIYRNNEQMRHLFKSSKDYRSIYSSAKYHGFEEFGLDAASLETKMISSTGTESMLQVFAKNEAQVRQKMQTLEHTLQFRELVEVSADGCKVIGKEEDYLLVNFLSLCRNRLYQFPIIPASTQRIYIDVFGVKFLNNNESLTRLDRIAEVLELPITIDYERVTINSNDEVRISVNGKDYLDLYKTSLLDTQMLLYIHHHSHQSPVKGKDIVDFFLDSNIFHINKPVPPERAKIEGLFFGYLGSQMQYGQILVQ